MFYDSSVIQMISIVCLFDPLFVLNLCDILNIYKHRDFFLGILLQYNFILVTEQKDVNKEFIGNNIIQNV